MKIMSGNPSRTPNHYCECTGLKPAITISLAGETDSVRVLVSNLN